MTTFTYKHYDIILSHTVSDVTLRIVDNTLFKVYQTKYEQISMHKFGLNSLKNFHAICSDYLDDLNDSSETFVNHGPHITLDVKFEKSDLVFNFILEIPLTDDGKMSGDQHAIKKLTKDLQTCQTITNDLYRLRSSMVMFNDLHKYLEVPVYKLKYMIPQGATMDLQVSLPIVCPQVNFTCHPSNVSSETNNWGILAHIQHIGGLTEGLKHIQTNMVVLTGNYPDVNIDCKNLPLATKHLTFSANPKMISVSNLNQLKNLETLEFASCGELTNIYEAIKGLKLKKVTLNKCPKCLDGPKLQADGIQVVVQA